MNKLRKKLCDLRFQRHDHQNLAFFMLSNNCFYQFYDYYYDFGQNIDILEHLMAHKSAKTQWETARFDRKPTRNLFNQDDNRLSRKRTIFSLFEI